MLVDKKILAGGAAMIVVGIALSALLTDMTPIGREGMTDEEIAEFLIEERENEDYTTLSGILVGVGFLLILISFGARRKEKVVQRKQKRNLRLSKSLNFLKECISLNRRTTDFFYKIC